MKTEEIRLLSAEEISAKLDQVRRQYAEMRMQHFGRPGTVHFSELKKNRRLIARLMTIQTEKNRVAKGASA